MSRKDRVTAIAATTASKDREFIRAVWEGRKHITTNGLLGYAEYPGTCSIIIIRNLRHAEFNELLAQTIKGLKGHGVVLAALSTNQIPSDKSSDVNAPDVLLRRVGFLEVGKPIFNRKPVHQTAVQLWRATYNTFCRKWGLEGDGLGDKWMEALRKEGKVY